MDMTTSHSFDSEHPEEGGMNAFRHYLLERLPETSRQQLLQDVVFTTVPPNRHIFREGQPADFICIIQKGRVKLSHIDSEGRENIIMLLSENDTIWESLFLYEQRFPYSAVTISETRVGKIYRENFSHILDNPQASMEIVTMLSRKLHDANERNQILATQDPEARVAGFLLYHRERGASDELNLQLEEIAGSVGLRPETVSRKIGMLCSRKLIERTGKGKIRILRADGLRKVFRGDDR